MRERERKREREGGERKTRQTVTDRWSEIERDG